MPQRRAIQQFALLTRDALGRYQDFGWADEHSFTIDLAGDLIDQVPFHDPAGSASRPVGHLVFEISERLLRGGILWLSARGHELVTGVLADDSPESRSALISSVLGYSIIGGRRDVLRVLNRAAAAFRDTDGRATLAFLGAFHHSHSGRFGTARRLLRRPLAPELAISDPTRSEGLLIAAFNELLDGKLRQAHLLLEGASLLAGDHQSLAGAISVLRTVTAARLGEPARADVAYPDCALRFPFIAPWVLTVESLNAIGWREDIYGLKGALRLVGEKYSGHWNHGLMHGMASGLLMSWHDLRAAAEHRRAALDHLYVAGLRLDAASRVLNRQRTMLEALSAVLEDSAPTMAG